MDRVIPQRFAIRSTRTSPHPPVASREGGFGLVVEAVAGVGHLHPHTSARPVELDTDRLVRSHAGVAHRIGHELAHKQQDVFTDGGGHRSIGGDDPLSSRLRAGIDPSVY